MRRPFFHRRLRRTGFVIVSLASGACHQASSTRADRSVYQILSERQRAALGFTTNVNLSDDVATADSGHGQMYSFTPHPLDGEMPEAFTRPVREDDANPEPSSDQADPSVDESDLPAAAPADGTEQTDALVFDLRQSLVYADRYARDLQNAKEDLYLAALALTLERHLWTPQFSAIVTSEFEDFEEADVFDQALTTVAEVAVRQRLPMGGEIAARAIASFVNDLNEHVTAGESGTVIVEGTLPLFRGAGRVAYESRYVAERELIYAVRTYERFRRAFLVTVASNYFGVQQRRTAIANTEQSYRSRSEAWEKADFTERMGRSKTVFDASRAQSSLRDAEVALARSREDYETAMDRFKILIGMPVVEPLDVPDQSADEASQSLDGLLTSVDVAEAIETALAYRLDLLTDADRVDDARRGVVIAQNRILPDLDFTGSLTSNSNPDHLSATSLDRSRTSWRAGLQLRVDDRQTERTGFRASQIDFRRAERNHDEFRDTVRADVRRAMRRIEQTADVRRIQEMNVSENERRLAAATVQFDLGKQTNQDVVDAENDLLAARNDFADAVAAYRIAILEFRRDTGTLRLGDNGVWVEPGESGP